MTKERRILERVLRSSPFPADLLFYVLEYLCGPLTVTSKSRTCTEKVLEPWLPRELVKLVGAYVCEQYKCSCPLTDMIPRTDASPLIKPTPYGFLFISEDVIQLSDENGHVHWSCFPSDSEVQHITFLGWVDHRFLFHYRPSHRLLWINAWDGQHQWITKGVDQTFFPNKLIYQRYLECIKGPSYQKNIHRIYADLQNHFHVENVQSQPLGTYNYYTKNGRFIQFDVRSRTNDLDTYVEL